MPKGHANIRNTYPSRTMMCVSLLEPTLRQHVETVRRRFEAVSWTTDARIDPADHSVIIVSFTEQTYSDCGHGVLQQRSSALTKLVRDNPPAEVEPLTDASLAPATMTPLSKDRSSWKQLLSSSETFRAGTRAEVVFDLSRSGSAMVVDALLTVLGHGHAVDIIDDHTVYRINPK